LRTVMRRGFEQHHFGWDLSVIEGPRVAQSTPVGLQLVVVLGRWLYIRRFVGGSFDILEFQYHISPFAVDIRCMPSTNVAVLQAEGLRPFC